MTKDYIQCEGYITHYLDEINVKYLSFDKEMRIKKLSAFLKKLVEPSSEYYEIKTKIIEFAEENDAALDNIRLSGNDYPDEIDW